ncbi:MAG: hypothetical protein J0H00_19815 [Burkholderiales bacterium]|nr:hypothetical protein [Burkholderiales bacterium]
MGLVRDALNALIAPSIKPVAGGLIEVKKSLEAIQIPAELAQRLEALESRPELSDDDADTLAAARRVIAELEEIRAGIQSTPQ